jgi:Pla-1/cef family extracellular lipase
MKIIERINSLNTALLVFGSALLLASCGGGGNNSSSLTINNVIPGGEDAEVSRIIFDAGAGDIPLPSDLLFSGTADGTLEPPDETDGRDAGSIDYTNPGAALGVADGWSTMLPMQVSLNMVEGATVDATTVNASTVVMIQTVTPPLDGSGTGCIPVEPFVSLSAGQPCGVAAPLTFGVDFVAVAGANTITIAPLSPLDASTTYVVGILEGVMDSRGEPILASTQYEQVTRNDIDIDFAPLDSLQDAVNLYEVMIDFGTGGSGAAPADALFSGAWTTASIGNAVASATSVLAASAPPSITGVVSAGVTAEAALIAAGALDPLAAGTTTLRFADLYAGQISLPYYSGTPDELPSASDPLADNWKALCDSPLAVLGAVAAGVTLTPGPNNAACGAFSGGQLADYSLDSERNLTKYNSIPAPRASATLAVQITVPNIVAGPWPIVILQHGITSRKEDMLAVTGALAAAGFATFAIDHPLHGSRALISASAGGASVSAGTDATVYMNLANLPVARDNLNQSMADMLGLRMGINSIAGALTTASFDTANVHVLGMSLGGISATGFVAQANSPTAPAGLDIQSAALIVPGGGIAPLLIESPGFGPLVQGNVLAGSGTDLGDTFVGFIGSNATCAGNIGCNFTEFTATLDATSLVEISSLVSQFGFAAQTIIDPADPNNFAASLAGLGTPIYMAEIVGNGTTNLSDQVIPNATVTPGATFGGTEPLAAFLGLTGVDADNAPQASGIVRFTDGTHGSLLDPTESLSVTTEMQTQAATFFAADVILISPGAAGADVLDLP